MYEQFQNAMDNLKENESEIEISYFEPRICVIGLGHVGLDLARLFRVKYKTVLFDIDQASVNDIEKIRHCNFYVVALPAQEELNVHPDLQPLWKACEILGRVISGGDIIVCESTFCPGVTEEACIPLLEKMSGLTCHIDFFAGSSPRRSNAGDKVHTAEKIKGDSFRSTPEIGKIVDEIYSAVVYHTQIE